MKESIIINGKQLLHSAIEIAISASKDRYELTKNLGFEYSPKQWSYIKMRLRRIGFDMDIFAKGPHRTTAIYEYQWKEKNCPACGESFKVKAGHPRERTVCSHSCANKYFRSSPRKSMNGRPKDPTKYAGENHYRKICFKYFEERCVICEFDCVVAVHHRDGNHSNNDPKNLIPLCPNHHQMAHMHKYAKIIDESVESYLSKNSPTYS